MKGVLKTCLTVGVCVAAIGLCAPATADIHYWFPGSHGGGDLLDWNNPNNWDYGGTAVGVPGPGDHVIIHAFSPMPIISGPAPDVAVLTPSWHNVDSHVALKAGSSLNATSFTRLGNGAGSHGKMTISGGSLNTPILQMSMVEDSSAYVHLNSGSLHAGGIGFHATAPQNIDLEPGAVLTINGDKTETGTGELPWWSSNDAGNLVSALDGTGQLNWSYDSGSNLTTVWATDNYTPVFAANFEDGEINPGKLGGIVNSMPYPDTQPTAFGQIDNYGWQNRGSHYLTGDATIVDAVAQLDENSAQVGNRTLRSDIELVLEEDSIYRFRFWYMVPEGQNLTFYNKVVCKDQTNNHLFVNTGDEFITAPAHNVWFSRTITFDTTGYANVGELIDFRFGAWFSDPGNEFAVFYTDNWSLGYIPEPSALLLLGLGSLVALRRRA